MQSILNPGDEVLLEKPCWVSFPEMVHFAEGKVVWVDTEATDFHLTAEMVKASITPKAKLLIINSPSNPTGRVIDPAEFKKIIAKEDNVPIVMLTADGAERDIVRALDAGANDYIVKPFKPDELMARLRRVRKSPA